MESLDYIINELKIFSSLFKGVKARYENDFVGNTHYIEISPDSFYQFEDKFKTWREEMIFGFIEKYPSENISIISDQNIVGISNCDYEFFEPIALPNIMPAQVPIYHNQKSKISFSSGIRTFPNAMDNSSIPRSMNLGETVNFQRNIYQSMAA